MTTGFIIGAGSGDGGGSGLEVCDIGLAIYVDETKGLRRYLNGQIVDINANTQAFLARLKEIQTTNPDYFTTEDNWQAEALLNIDGCVYKFVLNYSGETIVSVRLPKYPDYVEINAGGTLPVVGNGMTLGLTDGTLKVGLASDGTQYLRTGSNYYGTSVGVNSAFTSPVVDKSIGITTDPTKSGIQTTLKQTKLKMHYFIQIATGSETENNIINDIELNNPYSLFDSKYSDHELNNLSWLKSEGQWNAKSVYTDAYDKLLKVQNGTETVEGLSVKLSTETYTDYDFVLNTADETFRLPLKNHTADDGNSVLTLYFYIGETVQNANLIDAGRIGEQLANKVDVNSKVIDGQWVSTGAKTLSNATATGTYDIDVSPYLPNDNYIYEVMLLCRFAKIGATSQGLKTDLIKGLNFGTAQNSSWVNVTPIIPLKNRTIAFTISTNALDKSAIILLGYRRIGTNL